MRFLDKTQRAQIGFDFILDELEVITCYGLDEKKNIKPFKKEEKKQLMQELTDVEKIIKGLNNKDYYYRKIEGIFFKIKDIRNSIKRCKELNTLDDVELYEIKTFAKLISEIIEIMDKLELDIPELKFFNLRQVYKILDPENKNIPTFYIYDAYSTKLKDFRNQKRILEEKIIKQNDEDVIKQLKDERLNYVILEEQEELNIRKDLTKKIEKFTDSIENNIKCIGKLDLLISKAKLAVKYNGIKPSICDEMSINLKNSVNPEVKMILEKKNKEFTPISIELKEGVSVITGANMGGKTITLKTVVLNVYLANLGFFVFSEYARIPIVDFIQFISDDMQSITKGLSTFGAEIINLNKVIECAKRGNGLIVLDEFARGTNPKEGSYLVKALSRYLNRLKSMSLISTHYDGVVESDMVHYQVIGLKNINFNSLKQKIDLNKRFSVEIIQQHMDYRLEKISQHSEVPKDALNIALLLGIEKGISDIVKDIYAEGDVYGK
ncbi:hypothetical protein ACFIJ5_00810 [Haloimpatiens sp. FM7330]|uniref:lysine 5,6-aminomutase reactivase ATPase KamC n=1 Tax=Haloimpatiens sp. FM7330 TaxID=3298610 RepID=UPI003628DCA2